MAVEAVGPLTAMAAERGVTLVVDPLPAEVDGDALRLRQLVKILVDNAVAHTPPGGERHACGSAPPTAPASSSSRTTGRGSARRTCPASSSASGGPTTHPSGGTGLGLAIAAWIVTRHGGRISAGNRPEGGARLEARIPLRVA